jgi:hypothetical protein
MSLTQPVRHAPVERAQTVMLVQGVCLQGSARVSLASWVTIWGLFDCHLGADAAVGATRGLEGMTMRYALLMHYREPGEVRDQRGRDRGGRRGLGAYGRALENAGVLLSADVLQPTAATTTVTRREGVLRVQDGPFAEMKEAS